MVKRAHADTHAQVCASDDICVLCVCVVPESVSCDQRHDAGVL